MLTYVISFVFREKSDLLHSASYQYYELINCPAPEDQQNTGYFLCFETEFIFNSKVMF